MSDTALDEPPEDDSGSDTQDRFAWQHHCAAVDCIAMLTNAGIRRVVCEIHEDHVVDHGASGLELVSCKHREQSRGPWKLTELCLSGGVAHLFVNTAVRYLAARPGGEPTPDRAAPGTEPTDSGPAETEPGISDPDPSPPTSSLVLPNVASAIADAPDRAAAP
jgi:hypothetical protein